MNKLPSDVIIYHITSYLSIQDILALSLVSKNYKSMIFNADYLWRQLCNKDYPLYSSLFPYYKGLINHRDAGSWRKAYLLFNKSILTNSPDYQELYNNIYIKYHSVSLSDGFNNINYPKLTESYIYCGNNHIAFSSTDYHVISEIVEYLISKNYKHHRMNIDAPFKAIVTICGVIVNGTWYRA